jgi:copper chaperone CopZ
MKKTFKVMNVKCEGCAFTLSETLAEEFGQVSVNLTLLPREITLDIEDFQEEKLAKALRKLGYPLASDTMGFVATTSTKAKSFVSCAMGKINT